MHATSVPAQLGAYDVLYHLSRSTVRDLLTPWLEALACVPVKRRVKKINLEIEFSLCVIPRNGVHGPSRSCAAK